MLVYYNFEDLTDMSNFLSLVVFLTVFVSSIAILHLGVSLIKYYLS